MPKMHFDKSKINVRTVNPSARAAKSGDVSYNARRRYIREAQRYMKRADSVTGSERDRLVAMAKRSTEKALATYEGKPSKLSKPLESLVSSTGAKYRNVSPERVVKLVETSGSSKVSSVADRRDYEGRAIMNTSIGSRILASLEPIWADYSDGGGHVDWKEAERAIFEHLSRETGKEISDWMDVIEAFEENPDIGESLYAEPGNDKYYDSVVSAAQRAFNL